MADDDADALPPLDLPDQVFDVAFHPHADIVATALVSGQINACVIHASA